MARLLALRGDDGQPDPAVARPQLELARVPVPQRPSSRLEAVAGLGPARRRALLRHFGGLQGVLRAGIEDLGRAPGIGPALAQAIYEHLHPGAG